MSDPERTYTNPESEPRHRAEFPDHWERYEFARQFIKDKEVADVACGCGYGTGILAQSGKKLIGLDIDAETIAWARQFYGDRADFRRVAGIGWPIDYHSVDMVVSLETIEHLADPKEFLAQAMRVLRRDGKLLLSTPCNELNSRYHPENQFHLREYSWTEFGELVESAGFIIEQRWSQVSTLSVRWSALKKSRLGIALIFLKRMVPSGLIRTMRSSAAGMPGMKSGSIQPGRISGASVQIVLARPR